MRNRIDHKKREFMLQFLLNARLSGRQTDVDSDQERQSIVNAASDLYEKALEKCTVSTKEND